MRGAWTLACFPLDWGACLGSEGACLHACPWTSVSLSLRHDGTGSEHHSETACDLRESLENPTLQASSCSPLPGALGDFPSLWTGWPGVHFQSGQPWPKTGECECRSPMASSSMGQLVTGCVSSFVDLCSSQVPVGPLPQNSCSLQMLFFVSRKQILGCLHLRNVCCSLSSA